MLQEPWRIEMFGGLKARQGEREITRFQTHKAGALLAYLAYHLHQVHSREQLAELLWPETPPETGRHNLRQALTSLRRQLEPPGMPAGTVLIADRAHIYLRPTAVTTDVTDFETALRSAENARDNAERVQALSAAVAWYRGELLPGHYEEWVLPEQRHWTERHLQALRQLKALLAQTDSSAPAVTGVPIFPQDVVPPAPATPASLSATSPIPRLPVQFTRFFGREAEIAQLEVLLGAPTYAEAGEEQSWALGVRRWALGVTHAEVGGEPSNAPAPGDTPLRERSSARLVTLTGPGGSGKTRLAMEAARRLKAAFAEAVCFVPLADLSDARLIFGALAEALCLQRSGSIEPLDQVVAALSRQPTLVILDNFEQLVEEGAILIQALLERVPTLTLLVTSRQRLNLPGEREFPVPPLPTPAEAELPERLLAFSSVQLFADRAQAVRPDFQITSRNVAAVATLCVKLEGLPLAIELAAARAQVLTPAQMLAQLAHRFDFLVSRQRTTAERHRTLRAAIDWSYRLLTPELQRCFARLAVFRGGWTAEAAAAVCEESAALDVLEQMRECSLIQAIEEKNRMRFRMLETLREYAWEQLTAQEQTTLQQRHADYFLRLADRGDSADMGSEHLTQLEQLAPELSNLWAALDWYQSQEESAQQGLRLATALGWFWLVGGYWREGKERLTLFLEQTQSQGATMLRVKGYLWIGRLVSFENDFETAQDLLERCLSMAQELGDQTASASALEQLGDIALRQDDLATAQGYLERGLAIWQDKKDRAAMAAAFSLLGNVKLFQEDYTAARACYESSLRLRRELKEPTAIALSLSELGLLASCEHDYSAAQAFYQESLDIAQQAGDRLSVAGRLWNLGNLACVQGDYARARRLLEESQAQLRELGHRMDLGVVLYSLACAAIEQDDHASARRVLEEALTLLREMGNRRGFVAWLEVNAYLAESEGQMERAARLFGTAEALRDALRYHLWLPLSRARYERWIAAARAALAPEIFAAAWAAGRAMPLEEAIAEARHTN
jgi:predicted ATPase